MNHLIKHFAKEAGINLLLSDKKKLEKFANSLIDHCAKICARGSVDGWQIDEHISGAFATEIKNEFKKFDNKS